MVEVAGLGAAEGSEEEAEGGVRLDGEEELRVGALAVGGRGALAAIVISVVSGEDVDL